GPSAGGVIGFCAFTPRSRSTSVAAKSAFGVAIVLHIDTRTAAIGVVTCGQVRSPWDERAASTPGCPDTASLETIDTYTGPLYCRSGRGAHMLFAAVTMRCGREVVVVRRSSVPDPAARSPPDRSRLTCAGAG